MTLSIRHTTLALATLLTACHADLGDQADEVYTTISAASRGPALRQTTTAEVAARIAAKETFVFVSLSVFCSGPAGPLKTLAEFTAEDPSIGFDVVVFDGKTEIGKVPEPAVRAALDASQGGVPSMHLFVRGELVDVSSLLLEHHGVRAFLDRNLRGINRPLKTKSIGETPEKRRHTLNLYGALRYNDLRGVDASYMTLSQREYEGSDMRNADLSHTFISNVSFTYADLRGVSFEGATFEGPVYWGHAICPDGTSSAANGYTCAGHLEGAPVEGIAVDHVGATGPSLVDQMSRPD
jgi:hypothetical protein